MGVHRLVLLARQMEHQCVQAATQALPRTLLRRHARQVCYSVIMQHLSVPPHLPLTLCFCVRKWEIIIGAQGHCCLLAKHGLVGGLGQGVLKGEWKAWCGTGGEATCNRLPGGGLARTIHATKAVKAWHDGSYHWFWPEGNMRALLGHRPAGCRSGPGRGAG